MSQIHDNTLEYTRGATTIEITGFTPEKQDVNQLAAYGIVLINERIQDFVFNASELSALSPPVPQNGDTITWGTHTFSVMKIGDSSGGEIYRYTTSSREAIRVHTKQTT